MSGQDEKDAGELTLILSKARLGDPDARKRLLPMVYEELRSIARNKMRRSPREMTLQPTALVHEVYVRSLGEGQDFESRRHFFFIAAQAMRDILVDRARARDSLKRGGDQAREELDEVFAMVEAPDVDILALHDGLRLLEKDHPRPYEVVMLRFFAGLSSEECASVLDVSLKTVKRDWRFARVFLKVRLES